MGLFNVTKKFPTLAAGFSHHLRQNKQQRMKRKIAGLKVSHFAGSFCSHRKHNKNKCSSTIVPIGTY